MSDFHHHPWADAMMESRNVGTAPGMMFDVSAAGGANAALVLMLHGFGVSRFFWDAQVRAVAEAGYFAVAPNQRGYAAGARPDPADYPNYRVDRLIGDALDDAAAAASVGADCVLYSGGLTHPENLAAAGVPVADTLAAAVALATTFTAAPADM